MKTLFTSLLFVFLSYASYAQLPNGSIAPYLDVTDINGNNHNLDSLLGQGKKVIVVFSATWSGPDFNFISTQALQEAYVSLGPDGSDELEILFIEADMNTTIGDLYGDGSMTQGDYVSLINFPIINLTDSTIVAEWQIIYFPTVYLVCPSGFVNEIGQMDYNQLMYTINNPSLSYCEGLTLNNNAALTNMSSSGNCGGSNLEVTLYNTGLNPLTACTLQVQDSLGYNNIIEWTGYLANNEFENIPLGTFEYEVAQELTVTILTSDDNPFDNSIMYTVYPVSPSTSHIQVDLLTDSWPGEISWNITNSLNQVVLSSPYYTNQATQYVDDYFLTELGCYQFHIYDSFGDGLAWEGDISGHITINSIDADGNITPLFIYDGSYQYYDLHFGFEVTELVPVSITGTVYHDANENGYKETSEVGIGGIEVHLDELVTITNPDGSYIFNDVDSNNDQIYITYDNTVWPTNTTPTSYDLTQAASYNYTFGLSENDPNYNLNYYYSEPWFFCGFNGYLYLTVTNNGNQPTDGVLTYALDPLLTYVLAYPTPASISNNVITWNIEDLAIGNGEYFYIEVLAPTFEQMGEMITHDVVLTSYDSMGNVTDTDSGNYSTILACSYDPNDKAGTPLGETDAHYIMNGTDLEYLIRFQNTGNYQAFDIHVLDELDTDLDWTTFEIVATSHYCQPTMNMQTGEIDFYFPDINLPDSSSNEAGSHGFIRYRISPQPALPEMTTIENTAYIYFDFNPAVITNTTLHTISDLYYGIEENNLATLQLYPMPANDIVTLSTTNMTGATHISITDMLGRTAIDCGNYYTNTCRIDVSALPDGIYTIVVQSLEGDQTATAKMVVKK